MRVSPPANSRRRVQGRQVSDCAVMVGCGHARGRYRVAGGQGGEWGRGDAAVLGIASTWASC